MRSLEEIENALRGNPDDFDTLYEYTRVLFDANHVKYSFASTERAIAVYESAPDPAQEARYMELKRFRQKLILNYLDALLDEAWPFLDARWTPVFKLGRPREIALLITPDNVHLLPALIKSDSFKRLRFLSLTFVDCADEALDHLQEFRFDPIRIMNLCFNSDVHESAFDAFWQKIMFRVKNLVGVSLRMPHLTDKIATTLQNYTSNLESLSLLSLDRTTLTHKFCEVLADDARSQRLTNLAIVGSCLGDKGLLTLLSSDNFANLQTLDLHDGTLTNAAARIIAADIKLPQLRSIDLRYNQIDPAGLDILSRVRLELKVSDQHNRPAGRLQSRIL